MNHSTSRRIIDLLVFAVLLGGAGFVMYNLLPQRTLPGQEVVPSLPPSAFDPLHAFLTVFIVMTTVGAPVTGAIVLALLLKLVSRNIPNAATPEPKIEKRAPAAASKELSKGEATFWKIAAAILILVVIVLLVIAIAPSIVQMF